MKHFPIRPEVAASILCLSTVSLLALFYLWDRPLYIYVMQAISVAPWDHPFMDWEWVPSSVQCWAQGVNVYVDNTCYAPVPHIKFAYSPLMLRATFLPSTAHWTNAIGLGMAVLFSLSILLLRAPRTGFALVVMVLSTISGETAFALERGNVDVLAFVLAAVGVAAWAARSLPARLAGYAVFTFAGLMKFYPLVLLLLALRERRRDFVLITLAVGAAIAYFLWLYADELRPALHGVPGGSPFFYSVGAMLLPASIAPDLARVMGNFGGLLQRLLWVAMCGATLLLGTLLAMRGGVRAALDGMPKRDVGMLLAGALLMGGCFVSGNSVGYRAVLLVLAVPGLLTLARTLPGRAGRACFQLGCVAAPFVMWAPGFKQALYASGLNVSHDARASTAGLVHFYLTELAWWWLMPLLLSAVIGFVLTSARQLIQLPAGLLPARRAYETS